MSIKAPVALMRDEGQFQHHEGRATRRWLKVKQKYWTIGDDRWTRPISVAR